MAFNRHAIQQERYAVNRPGAGQDKQGSMSLNMPLGVTQTRPSAGFTGHRSLLKRIGDASSTDGHSWYSPVMGAIYS